MFQGFLLHEIFDGDLSEASAACSGHDMPLALSNACLRIFSMQMSLAFCSLMNGSAVPAVVMRLSSGKPSRARAACSDLSDIEGPSTAFYGGNFTISAEFESCLMPEQAAPSTG